ncbi:unnamed protein product, partial [Gadus morhua 'NCC']
MRDLKKCPRVSLLQRSPSSPVVCHATGFYPDRVVVFWRRDGQELHEQVDPGEVLPNHDGTFQVSVDLDLTAVPQEDWGRYECVVQLKGIEDIPTPLDPALIRTNWGKTGRDGGGRSEVRARPLAGSHGAPGGRSEPVLWPGHMGLQVGGQRSEPVLWPGHMGLQVGGQRSEPVLWPGHMGLQVGGQRSEPVLWPGHMGLQVGGQSPSSGRVTWGSRPGGGESKQDCSEVSEGRSRETVGLNLRPFKCGGGGDVRIPHNDKRLPIGQAWSRADILIWRNPIPNDFYNKQTPIVGFD